MICKSVNPSAISWYFFYYWAIKSIDAPVSVIYEQKVGVTHNFPHSLRWCDDTAAVSGRHSPEDRLKRPGLLLQGGDVSAHDISQASGCGRNMDAGS